MPNAENESRILDRGSGIHFGIEHSAFSIDRELTMDPILTKYVGEPNSATLDFYLKHDGYQGLKKAFGMQPNDVIETVKASGLRGRGGAGFPTGMKWQF